MQRNNTESAAFRYDSQGRRFEKKVSVAGTITSWERYLYRGYLQIAAFDVTETESSSSVSEEGGAPKAWWRRWTRFQFTELLNFV